MANSIKQLVKNTAALYILTFSSQLINIILIPYETRVLGAEAYGTVSLGASLSIILGLLFDFGFILSATGEVARGDRSSETLSRLVSNVSAIKISIILITGVILLIPLECVSPFSQNKALFALYFGAYAVNAMLPDYIYRGIEDMRAITVRTLIARVVCAIPILIFVRASQDVWLIPLFLLMGNLTAVIFSYYDLYYNHGIRYAKTDTDQKKALVKLSLPFFISRFASTFYQSMNSVILGLKYPGQPVVGYYGAAEKYLAVIRQGSSPIADSIYPYMVRKKDYKLCIRLLIIICPVILLCAIPVFIFAEQISVFIFGEGYEYTGQLLRAILPAIAVIFPTYIICFPLLVPMGLSKKANFSNLIGAACQIGLLAILAFFGLLNAFTLCLASSCSEVAVFIYRLWVLIANRDLMK